MLLMKTDIGDFEYFCIKTGDEFQKIFAIVNVFITRNKQMETELHYNS